jgi:hypothetical protein
MFYLKFRAIWLTTWFYLEFRAMWLTTWLYELCPICNSEQFESLLAQWAMSYLEFRTMWLITWLYELCPMRSSEPCDSLLCSMSYVLSGIQRNVTHYLALWGMSYLEIREMWLTTWLYELCPMWISEQCDFYGLCITGIQSTVTETDAQCLLPNIWGTFGESSDSAVTLRTARDIRRANDFHCRSTITRLPNHYRNPENYGTTPPASLLCLPAHSLAKCLAVTTNALANTENVRQSKMLALQNSCLSRIYLLGSRDMFRKSINK